MEKNLENYEAPKMEIVFFDGSDIMAKSYPTPGGEIIGGDDPFDPSNF